MTSSPDIMLPPTKSDTLTRSKSSSAGGAKPNWALVIVSGLAVLLVLAVVTNGIYAMAGAVPTCSAATDSGLGARNLMDKQREVKKLNPELVRRIGDVVSKQHVQEKVGQPKATGPFHGTDDSVSKMLIEVFGDVSERVQKLLPSEDLCETMPMTKKGWKELGDGGRSLKITANVQMSQLYDETTGKKDVDRYHKNLQKLAKQIVDKHGDKMCEMTVDQFSMKFMYDINSINQNVKPDKWTLEEILRKVPDFCKMDSLMLFRVKELLAYDVALLYKFVDDGGSVYYHNPIQPKHTEVNIVYTVRVPI